MAAAPVLHGSQRLYREANLVGGWSNEEGWVGEGGGQANSLGLEYFSRHANEFGDFLTLDVQIRLSCDTSGRHVPRWGLEVHNAWADYKLGLGKAVRLGHFQPAYGLEPSLDTHGALLQTLAMQDIGFKHDWGLGYRSGLGSLDIQAAAGLGSGMGIDRRDRSFLATARMVYPLARDLEWGLALLRGRVLRSMPHRTLPRPEFSPETVTKTRIGAHGRYRTGPWVLAGEATGGRNAENGVIGGLLRIDYTMPRLHPLTLHAQGWRWAEESSHGRLAAYSLALGASYRVTSSLTMRAAVFTGRTHHGERDTRILAQAYYYG